MAPATDVEIGRFNGNPALQPGSPYQRFPERATWTEGVMYRRPDGSCYREEREVSRWGGAYAVGDIRVCEIA